MQVAWKWHGNCVSHDFPHKDLFQSSRWLFERALGESSRYLVDQATATPSQSSKSLGLGISWHTWTIFVCTIPSKIKFFFCAKVFPTKWNNDLADRFEATEKLGRDDSVNPRRSCKVICCSICGLTFFQLSLCLAT